MSHHHKPHAVSEKMYIDTISSDLTNRKKRLKRKKKDILDILNIMTKMKNCTLT